MDLESIANGAVLLHYSYKRTLEDYPIEKGLPDWLQGKNFAEEEYRICLIKFHENMEKLLNG
jgi:hypothetical protein